MSPSYMRFQKEVEFWIEKIITLKLSHWCGLVYFFEGGMISYESVTYHATYGIAQAVCLYDPRTGHGQRQVVKLV